MESDRERVVALPPSRPPAAGGRRGSALGVPSSVAPGEDCSEPGRGIMGPAETTEGGPDG